jgi:iron(III) transport system permease protein
VATSRSPIPKVSRAAFNRLKWSIASPQWAIGLLLLLTIGFLIIAPAWEILETSVHKDGALTLDHWIRVVTGRMSRFLLYKPLLNTLLMSVGVTVLSLAIGAALAWLVTRTDLPFKGVVERVSIIPYIIPSWVISLAWITMFRNSDHFGGYQGLVEYFLGANTPFWVSYGLFPIVITLSIHYFPYTFLLVSAALKTVDSHLEESAEVLGASRAKILRRITFPLILPALLSSVILTFSKGLGTFGAPAFLGPPAHFQVLSTVIFSMLNTGSYGEAYTLAIITTVLGALTVYMNVKMISARRSYTTLSGKGVRVTPFRLGKWRWPIVTAVMLFIFGAAILPVGVLIWQSLLLYPGDFGLSNLTLHFWIGESLPELGDAGEPGVLRNDSILRASYNSVFLSVMTGFISGLIGFLIGYAVVKAKGSLVSKLLDQLSFLPYLMPALPFAATYLVLFAHPIGPIPALYGTMTLLVLISIVKRLPYSSRAGISSMVQLGKELEESAIVLGAGWWRRFRKIIFPLAKSGFIAGFLLTFITTMRELSLIILLVTPRTEVLTTVIFRYAEEGIPQFTNALAMVIVFFTLIVYFIVQSTQSVDMFGGSD